MIALPIKVSDIGRRVKLAAVHHLPYPSEGTLSFETDGKLAVNFYGIDLPVLFLPEDCTFVDEPPAAALLTSYQVKEFYKLICDIEMLERTAECYGEKRIAYTLNYSGSARFPTPEELADTSGGVSNRAQDLRAALEAASTKWFADQIDALKAQLRNNGVQA